MAWPEDSVKEKAQALTFDAWAFSLIHSYSLSRDSEKPSEPRQKNVPRWLNRLRKKA
jgi:hypothetical protein